MPENENQPITDYRQGLVDRLQPSYPDMDFSSPNGPDGPNGPDNLLQAVSELLSKLETENATYKQHEDQLMGLLKVDDRAAGFINEWLRTGNAALAFRKHFGAKAYEAMNTEEGAAILAELQADDARKEAESNALKQEKQANLEQSLDAFDRWADEKGFTDQQKLDLFIRMNNMLQDAEKGIYSVDLFQMAFLADNYSTDVESARREGEVAGRNARIDQIMKNNGQQRPSSVPMLQGQGQRSVEGPKEKPMTEGDMWEL